MLNKDDEALDRLVATLEPVIKELKELQNTAKTLGYFVNHHQAVKRNEARFPPSFRFQLTEEEHARLRSQFVILKDSCGRGQHEKYRPCVFTE